MLRLLPSILFVLAVIVVFILLKRFGDAQVDENFDERQILYRQKAYSNAVWAAVIFNIFIFIEGDSLAKYISLSFVGIATIFLLAGVFAVSSVLYDAYFAARKKKRFVTLFSLVCLLQFVLFVMQWSKGEFFQQGHLYLTFRNSVPVISVITFGFILLATAYKTWIEKNEEEE